MSNCGESVRVAYPLFQVGGGGSTPTSPLQLKMEVIPFMDAKRLNALWHSRLPRLGTGAVQNQPFLSFGAEFGGRWYAAAIWSNPTRLRSRGRNSAKPCGSSRADSTGGTDVEKPDAGRVVAENVELKAQVRLMLGCLQMWKENEDFHKGTRRRAWDRQFVYDETVRAIQSVVPAPEGRADG